MPVGPGHPQTPSVYQPPPWPPVHCPTPGGARGEVGQAGGEPPSTAQTPIGVQCHPRGARTDR